MRSPGFCNVNQLFDANLLQAGRVEVLKGPGAVVFGSNALYGIINVVTRSVDATPSQVRVEGGSRDYYRVSASGAVDGGIALSAQTSQYGGYQDASATISRRQRCASTKSGVTGASMARLKAVSWTKKQRAIFGALKRMRTIRPVRKIPILKLTGTPGLAEAISA